MSKEIDLGAHDEIEYMSRKIREVLGTNHIGNPDSNVSRDIIEKQFNDEREHIRNLFEEILKKKCVEMGIDPESLRVDWSSIKLGEEK
ncbi:MAG: hypothetical protein EB127_13295 [Alphaproteobacteria bacterium]|nr:hypothetical protein [Alphaproteobacteria bacterium]